VISVVVPQLRKLTLRLADFQYVNISKETKNQGIVDGLCALLRCCINETEIDLSIKLESLST